MLLTDGNLACYNSFDFTKNLEFAFDYSFTVFLLISALTH
jgi:hypothetical protein